MMRLVYNAFFLVIVAFGLPLQAESIRVVATTSMIADAVRAIGGAHTQVTVLMRAGVDPHSYRQTKSDVTALVRADLVFANGLFLEAQMDSFLRRLGKRKPVVFVAESINKADLIAHPVYSNQYDPHIWMAPPVWQNAIFVIAQSLALQLPAHKAAIDANAVAYARSVQNLHSYIAGIIATIPMQQRVLVTAHDAFHYFARTYTIEVQAVQGMSTNSEAGLQRITQLVTEVTQRQIPAVFAETSVSDRSIRAVLEGAAARGHDMQLGGALFSDAMGQEGTYEATYIGMLDHNATVIARALGGIAPACGMTGQLSVCANELQRAQS